MITDKIVHAHRYKFESWHHLTKRRRAGVKAQIWYIHKLLLKCLLGVGKD